MARKPRRSPFYAPRRVPHAFAPAWARVRLAPLIPSLALAGAATLVADSPALPEALRPLVGEKADRWGDGINQKSQRLFFDEPGLDTLLIRGLSRWSRALSRAGRLWLRAVIAAGADQDGRAATLLPLIPTRGYDSLMTWMLTAGTAVGLIRGGRVHVAAFLDDGHDAGPFLPVPEGHPVPKVHRLMPPRTLGDMAADIDDLYWAGTHGQAVKITRVGPGGEAGSGASGRRWLVALPGTDHLDLPSTPNPADTESNIREVLGLPSAMRVGMVMALHRAMAADGIPPRHWAREQVFICGHSQGGMVAVALAALDPAEAGADVRAILSMGSPARRFRIRPDVTMVAVEHDQDVIPSFDGSPARAPDQRVTVGRRLVRPRREPLYYAHSSTTYNETVRRLERKVAIAPWGRLARAVGRLQSFLPTSDEPTRVWVFDVWQEVLRPTKADTWDTFIQLDRSDREPVECSTDWTPATTERS